MINDNNSRVQASVAVVCAYSCIAPVGSSCSGGGGGSACSSAYRSAQKSNDYSDSSDEFYEAAKKNGGSALLLQGNKMNQSFSGAPPVTKPGSGEKGAPSLDLPESCRLAGQTGNVTDRINCAAATDPALPSFVKDPKFLQDFQNITGQPLQAVINKSEETLLEDYAAGGLQHAYNGLKGATDMSFADFSKKSAALFKSIKDSFTSRPSRPDAVDEPQSNPSADSVPPVEGQSLNSMGGVVSSQDSARSKKNLSPENDPDVSLFARISARHRDFANWLNERR